MEVQAVWPPVYCQPTQHLISAETKQLSVLSGISSLTITHADARNPLSLLLHAYPSFGKDSSVVLVQSVWAADREVQGVIRDVWHDQAVSKER